MSSQFEAIIDYWCFISDVYRYFISDDKPRTEIVLP